MSEPEYEAPIGRSSELDEKRAFSGWESTLLQSLTLRSIGEAVLNV
jgi:hypothetical protein